MQGLLDVLDRWRPFTALVLGDFMLDQQVYGDAERLSADAPVPVLHVRRTESTPGGAANVCMDLAALGGRVTALGVRGDDAAGREMCAALDRAGIDTGRVVVDPHRPTTQKQNLIGLAQTRHPQKMFRVDIESREDVTASTSESLARAAEEAVPRVDVVCIEDYGKGVCGPQVCGRLIAAAKRAGKPVFVDPARGTNFAKYRGCAAITPNRTEAELATGLRADGEGSPEHNAALARVLLDRLELEACVLTLDRHGALLLERGRAPASVATVARRVYDVTGAGDMFVAGLAAARANGAAWDDAVRFANAAAGLEVEVFGVEPIPFERVHASILGQVAGAGKLRSLEQVAAEIAGVKRRGGRVVFTNGCFDILHSGHVSLLERAAGMGDYLVVAINSDSSVRKLKGPGRPVNGQGDRARVLGALAGVSAVVVFEEDTPLRLIETLRPHILVKGADYSVAQVVGREVVEAYGGRVELVDVVPGRSTSSLLERMKGG
jgi:D-beta-D-heptose 7-phosphate kinase / D-beta-D-heptose 1-phosphate adenosyltransferase